MNQEQKTLFDRLKVMPQLSHWPNRPAPFRWDGSQVIAHIRRLTGQDINAAAKLFEKARVKKVLLFDHKSLTWRGNPAWVPKSKRRTKSVSAESCTTPDKVAIGTGC